MPARFEVEVLTKFRSTGLSQVANEARSALAGVANQPGLSSAARVTRTNQIRTEAERAIQDRAREGITAARASGLTGNALASAEKTVREDASKARRAVNRLFTEITRETTDLGKRIAQAIDKSGIGLITPAQARGAVGLTSRPPTEAEARSAERAAKARTRAESERLLTNDPEYYTSQQTSRRAASERAAKVSQQAAADEVYLKSTAEAAAAKKEEADRIRAHLVGVSGAFTSPISDVRVQSAVQEKVEADLHAARVARARTAAEQSAGSAGATASSARREAERELTAAIHLNAKAEVRAAIQSGEGTKFQRLQARFQAGGSARLPSEFQKLGQFTGSRALTTIGYGVAGTALYGSVRAIGEMLKESEELDKVLNQIEAQLQATDAAGQFPQARAGILEIARETGAQADQIAAVQFQFQGAFRDTVSGQIDVAESLKQTEAAIKITAVTGLSLDEVLDSLTATAKTFKVDIEDIGDAALGVQERFGVLARETVTFVADLAPVAEQVGLSLADTASLAGVAQQVSGRSGSALAEGFGRILPQLQEVRTEILQIYNLPQLKDKQLGIAEAFGAGKTGDVFKRLVTDYGSLNEQQKQFVINLLGGRREAQVLIPVLQQSSQLTEEWARNAAGLNNDTGKTNTYFADLRQTVQNTQARMVEAFKQIGEALFRGGLADGLKIAANSAATLADALGLVFDVLEKLNSIGAPLDALIPGDIQIFDDLPGKLLLIVLTMGSVNKALQFFGTLLKTSAVAQTLQATASTEAAVANAAQAASSESVVIAAMNEARAVGVATAADEAQTVSSGSAAAANAAQAGAQGAAGAGRFAGLFSAGGASQVSAGLLPTTLAGAGIAVGGALVVGNSYINQRGSVKAAEDAYIDQLKTYSNEQLEAMSSQTTDFWGRVSNRFFGTELPEMLSAEQLTRNNAAGAASNITTLLGAHEDQLIRILKEAVGDPNDPATGSTVDALRGIIEANPDAGRQSDLASILGAQVEHTSRDGSTQVKVHGIDESDINPETIRKLITSAQEDGDFLAGEALRVLNDYILNNADLAALLDETTQKDLHDAAVEAAGGAGGYALQQIDQARDSYESGRTSSGTFLEKLRSERAAAELAANTSDNPDDDAAFFKADKETNEFLGQLKLDRIDALGNIVDLLSGGKDDARAGALLDEQIGLVRQFVTSGENTPDQRFAQIPVLMGLLRDKFERELSGIADDAEKARVEAAGFEIPAELQSLVVEQQLRADPAISGMIEQYANFAGISLDAAFTNVANLVIGSENTVQDITRQLIQQKITQLQEVIGRLSTIGAPTDLSGINTAIAGLQTLLTQVPNAAQPVEIGGRGYTGGNGGGGAADNADALRAAARARAEAQLDVMRAQADGDPVRLAQIDLQAANVARQYAENDADRLQAEAARIKAWQGIRDAQQDIDQARYELYAAEVQRDPVRSAQAQVSLAYIAIANSHGTADRIRAQIQMVNAQATLVQAQQDVTYSWLEGVESYFNIIGDSVRAAEIALQLAQTQLADIVADPSSGQAERNRAATAVREAEANLRNTKYDDQLGDIEYMLDLEKISVNQAIQMLQRMAEIPGLTEEQLRTIERRIRDLRDSVSGDLNFNIPDIKIPTLYEVRRLMGSGQTTSGTYQDNRQIGVTLQISENVDVGPVLNQLADMLNAPSVTGIYPRNY